LAFFGFPCEIVISGRSLKYCVNFFDRLRGSLGIFEQPAFAEATARQATDYPPSPDGYGGQAADVTDVTG